MKKIIGIALIVSLLIIGFIIMTPSETRIDSSVEIDKIIIEKSNRKLHIYSNDTLIKSYDISLGGNPIGHKEYEGDQKTPEGNYIINDKNPNSNFHKNLGISYPNEKDREHASRIGKSPGGDIKIHGLRNGLGWLGRMHLVRDWTAGCIAVTDDEIDELYGLISTGTPIEIKP